MKRLVTLTVTITSALALAACSNGDSASEGDASDFALPQFDGNTGVESTATSDRPSPTFGAEDAESTAHEDADGIEDSEPVQLVNSQLPRCTVADPWIAQNVDMLADPSIDGSPDDFTIEYCDERWVMALFDKKYVMLPMVMRWNETSGEWDTPVDSASELYERSDGLSTTCYNHDVLRANGAPDALLNHPSLTPCP